MENKKKKKSTKTNLVRVLEYKIKKSKRKTKKGGVKFIFSCSHAINRKKGIIRWIMDEYGWYGDDKIPAGNYIIDQVVGIQETVWGDMFYAEANKDYFQVNLAQEARKKYL